MKNTLNRLVHWKTLRIVSIKKCVFNICVTQINFWLPCIFILLCLCRVHYFVWALWSERVKSAKCLSFSALSQPQFKVFWDRLNLLNKNLLLNFTDGKNGTSLSRKWSYVKKKVRKKSKVLKNLDNDNTNWNKRQHPKSRKHGKSKYYFIHVNFVWIGMRI